MRAYLFMILVAASPSAAAPAFAADTATPFDKLYPTYPSSTTPLDTQPEYLLSVLMQGQGKVNRFWGFELNDGANALLRGWVPVEGAPVEFYVDSVTDCKVPEKRCVFTLGIRRPGS